MIYTGNSCEYEQGLTYVEALASMMALTKSGIDARLYTDAKYTIDGGMVIDGDYITDTTSFKALIDTIKSDAI